MKIKRKLFGYAVAVLVCFSSVNAFALSSFNPGDLADVLDSQVTDMIKTIAIGADHRAYMPATPMGYLMGIDAGIDVTLISLPSSFTTAFSLATDQATGALPATVPFPRVNLHKGLPWGVDLGFSIIKYQDFLASYGADVKWAYLKGGVGPAVALRASANYAKLWFMHTRSYTLDVVASKNLYVIDPYIGAGLQMWSGELAVPIGGPLGLSTTVSAHKSSMNPRIYGGLPFKALIVKLTAEAGYSFAGITTYGLKASLAF